MRHGPNVRKKSVSRKTKTSRRGNNDNNLRKKPTQHRNTKEQYIGSGYWKYDPIHPYNVYGKEPWCTLPMVLLLSGIIVFGVILIAAVVLDHSNHFWGHHDDDDFVFHGKKDVSITTMMERDEYSQMINRFQNQIDSKEKHMRCPIGSHAWHPQGTLEDPTCRVNFPWPRAVDLEIIHPEKFDEELRNKNDPCDSFESYVCHGWHLSDPILGSIGSTKSVPSSRGFSELTYRNSKLKMHTTISDTHFIDTTWDSFDDNFQNQLTRSKNDNDNNNNNITTRNALKENNLKVNYYYRNAQHQDNRIIFHKFVHSCANSMSGNLMDISEMIKQVSLLTNLENIDIPYKTKAGYTGFMFGRAQCRGVSPVFYAYPGLDITNKEREILYVEPSGLTGLRSTSVRLENAQKLLKFHNALVVLACRILFDKGVVNNNCSMDVLKIEDILVWNVLEKQNQHSKKRSFLFEPQSDGPNPTITKEGIPIIIDIKKQASENNDGVTNKSNDGQGYRHKFFYSDWWRGFEHGLVAGGCVKPESLRNMQRSTVWTNSFEYVDNFVKVLRQNNNVSSNLHIKENDWKTFLAVSIVLDYLEHSNFEKLEETLRSIEKGKRKSHKNDISSPQFPWQQQRHMGNPLGKPHAFTKPWEQNDVHVRGHYNHVLLRHSTYNDDNNDNISNIKNNSTNNIFDSVKKMFSSYLNSLRFLKNSIQGTPGRINKQESSWQLNHYITVDNTPDTERRLVFWPTCGNIAELYLPGVHDDSFAAVVTSERERSNIYDITQKIIEAITESIFESEILSDEAKQKLAEKARAISVRVAVPWHGQTQPDYSPANIQGKSFYFDSVSVRAWGMKREFDRVFSPQSVNSRRSVDPSIREGDNVQYHFSMPASAVNAYYSPEENSINILAGILGAPFYDSRYTNASLYATIGMVIGHELSHGFDSQGVKFDPKGSYRSWLSQKDETAYEKREKCFVQRYTRKTRLGNLNNGQKTITENIADTMGLRAALRAFLKYENPKDMKMAMREFLEAYGQSWCTNQNKLTEQMQIEMDVHSPANVRVDGAITNLRTKDGKNPLKIAFDCPADAKMVRDEPCTLW